LFGRSVRVRRTAKEDSSSPLAKQGRIDKPSRPKQRRVPVVDAIALVESISPGSKEKVTQRSFCGRCLPQEMPRTLSPVPRRVGDALLPCPGHLPRPVSPALDSGAVPPWAGGGRFRAGSLPDV